MSTIKELGKMISSLSLILGVELNLSFNIQGNSSQSISTIEDKKTILSYKLLVDGQLHNIFISSDEEFTKKEKELISYILNEHLEDKKLLRFRNKDKAIMRLLNEKLGQAELEDMLTSLGLSKNKEITVMAVKLMNTRGIEEIISIIENLNKDNLVAVKQADDLIIVIYQQSSESYLEIARLIVDTVESEMLQRIKIGISSLCSSDEIMKAYNESLKSIDIGLRFRIPRSIFYFRDLTVYKILFHMSEEELIKHFNGSKIDELDTDEIKTAVMFLENNLNMSESARKLFIHRNTLIYRIEKIHKITGFDLRIFNQALEFKLMLIIFTASSKK